MRRVCGTGQFEMLRRWQGFGENSQYFKGDNATEYGRAPNRRVEIKIVPVTQSDVSAS